MDRYISNVDPRLNEHERRVWDLVSLSPVRNLWKLEGLPAGTVVKRIWKSILQDHLFGHAAELGFYFLFALFPTLLCASSILGLAARSAHQIYDNLLHYLALVIPTSALGTVLNTFNETAASASSGKISFGLMAAIWSASVGISAVQETLNGVYKLIERRSYIKARVQAIGLTIILIVTMSLCLSSMFAGDFAVAWIHHTVRDAFVSSALAMGARLAGWILAMVFLALSFDLTYYWAPDFRQRRWHWITPGCAIGMFGWLIASLGLRIYLHFFNTYSVTYGSLGAVIILLTWFYITGLMLLLGAEINSEIEAAAVEARLTINPSGSESIAPSGSPSIVPAA